RLEAGIPVDAQGRSDAAGRIGCAHRVGWHQNSAPVVQNLAQVERPARGEIGVERADPRILTGEVGAAHDEDDAPRADGGSRVPSRSLGAAQPSGHRNRGRPGRWDVARGERVGALTARLWRAGDEVAVAAERGLAGRGDLYQVPDRVGAERTEGRELDDVVE